MELRGENLSKSTAGHLLFHGINVRVTGGKSLAIVGPSGSGKTTLLNCLGLILATDSGKIFVDGRDYGKRTKHDVLKFWRESASFIYQDSGVIDDETVLYNVALCRHSTTKRKEAALAALTSVGLQDRLQDKAVVLSGGEKQRLGVARAIFKRAAIIFADEPTASLDEANRELVWNMLRERMGEGAAIVLSTHDLDLAKRCDSIIDLG